MEKYSKWRDAGTGIQPFLQPIPARTQQAGLQRLISAAKNYALGPLLATTRVLALGLTASLDLAACAIGSLIPPSRLKRLWQRCTRSVCARLALLIMGFYAIDTKAVSLQKGRRSSPRPKATGGPQSGDIILANHVSYTDVLYLAARFNPVFVEVDNASMYARPISLWAALRAPGRLTPALLPAKDAQPLSRITQNARLQSLGPLVVFPENATTNGRALLQLLPVFEEAENQDEKSALHLMAFKYPFAAFSPAYSVGNQLAHLFALCCQVYNSMAVRVLEDGEAPRVRESAVFCANDVEPVDLDAAVAERLAQLSRLRMTKMSAMDKRDFLAFYYKRAKGYRSI
ncbi:Vacuolar protein sorting protein vps66 [Kickxella alabastrina]|uniref:Vacuolar protein sorting protein vps66 n=1 Tax=Kickxella alabastrina TaxID=61397 RepID=A0ACC1I5V9_9FUNG|nr:Vacuolar protein sorting protein vps66 [Kickxella alabastrina]